MAPCLGIPSIMSSIPIGARLVNVVERTISSRALPFAMRRIKRASFARLIWLGAPKFETAGLEFPKVPISPRTYPEP